MCRYAFLETQSGPALFQFPRCRLHFVQNIHELKRCIRDKSQAKVVVWGHSHSEVVEYAKQQQLPLLRMEDGFYVLLDWGLI